MAKKLIVLLLAFCMLVSGVVFSSEMTEYKDYYEYQKDYLMKIGIIDENFPESDNVISRAELSLYSSRLFGDKYTAMPYTGRYTDIDKDSEYCSAVEFLSENGIMSGYGNGIFMPGRPAEVQEAVKVLTDILGYRYMANINGGYPVGYNMAAKKINLLNEIGSLGGYLTGEIFAGLLYNALEVDIAKTSSIYVGAEGLDGKIAAYEGVNLLSENFDMYHKKGRVDATEILSLTGSYARENAVVIDGEEFLCDDEKYFDFLGHTVKYVCRIDEETGRNYLVYAGLYKSSSVELTGGEPVSLSGMTLTYYDENDKEKNVQLSPEGDIIFNFEKVGLKSEYFKKPYSKIILIDNNDDRKIDVVIIEELNSLTAGTIGSSKIVFDKEKASVSLSLDEDDYEHIILLNSNGEKISYEDIKYGSTITYVKNGDIIKCYISENNISGKVESEQTRDGIKRFKIDGELYSASPLLAGGKSYIGKTVTAYIDVFGNISALSEDTGDGTLAGFLIAAGKASNSLDEDYAFKIFTAEGEEEIFKSAKTVKVNGVNTKRENLPSSFTQDIMAYSLNNDGEINRVEFPVAKDNSYEDGRLMKSFENTNAYAYVVSNKTFDARCVVDNKTTFFSISTVDHDNDSSTPQVYDTDTLQIITNQYFVNREFYNIKAYTMKKDAQAAVAVLNIGAYSADVKVDYNLFLIDEVSTAYEDGRVWYEVTGYERGVLKNLSVKDDYEKAFETLEVEKGDVLRCSLNTLNQITGAEMIYDVSEPVSASNPKEKDPDVFYASPRINYSKVMDKSTDGMVYYLNINDSSKYSVSGYTGFLSDCLAFPATRYSKLNVLEIYGNRVIVRSGTVDDIEKGDTFIDYTSQQAPYGLVLIKQ